MPRPYGGCACELRWMVHAGTAPVSDLVPAIGPPGARLGKRGWDGLDGVVGCRTVIRHERFPRKRGVDRGRIAMRPYRRRALAAGCDPGT